MIYILLGYSQGYVNLLTYVISIVLRDHEPITFRVLLILLVIHHFNVIYMII